MPYFNNLSAVTGISYQFTVRLRDVRSRFAELLGKTEAGPTDRSGDDQDHRHQHYDTDHRGGRPVAAGRSPCTRRITGRSQPAGWTEPPVDHQRRRGTCSLH